MPKIVDRDQRRRDISDAVFRIARRDGISHASLRNIATEAGLSIGSVRHYFTDHADVLAFAMRELAEQTAQRILTHVRLLNDPPPGLDRLAVVRNGLAEFLPLDEQRNLEVTVWLEFAAASRTNRRLQEYARTIHDGERRVVERVLTRFRESGQLIEPVDIRIETERLTALIDGLSMNMVFRPELLDGDTALTALNRHLDSLLHEPKHD